MKQKWKKKKTEHIKPKRSQRGNLPYARTHTHTHSMHACTVTHNDTKHKQNEFEILTFELHYQQRTQQCLKKIRKRKILTS